MAARQIGVVDSAAIVFSHKLHSPKIGKIKAGSSDYSSIGSGTAAAAAMAAKASRNKPFSAELTAAQFFNQVFKQRYA